VHKLSDLHAAAAMYSVLARDADTGHVMSMHAPLLKQEMRLELRRFNDDDENVVQRVNRVCRLLAHFKN
jgi:hypothetical protein